MTLNQLLSEVYSLGFDEADGLDESFVFSANRALKMIYTELVPSVRVKLSVSGGSEKTLDLREIYDDVMLITSAPKDLSGRVIQGAFCEGYTVTIPSTFSGDAIIGYKPLPKVLTVDDGDEKIDVPSFASHLLPLLTASFVFLDDDGEKADYYMTLYRHEVLKLNQRIATSYDNTYTDVTGWA